MLSFLLQIPFWLSQLPVLLEGVNVRFCVVNVGQLFRAEPIDERDTMCIKKTVFVLLFIFIGNTTSFAGVIFGNNGLNGGFRWDAAERTIGGFERSLNGGLRYSLQGGSFESFRDSFSWSGGAPSVPVFQSAVQSAFDAWGATDPVSGLTSQLRFVPDLMTSVDSTVQGGVRFGAEIDLFATNLGDSGTRGFASFNAVGGTVTLTSGTSNYSAAPISGADITLNSNAGAV